MNLKRTMHYVIMVITCRICLEEMDIPEIPQDLINNKFVSPCQCNGTSKYVHTHCIDQWRSIKLANYIMCNTCRAIYDIFIGNDKYIHAIRLSILTLLFSVGFSFVSYYFRFWFAGNIVFFISKIFSNVNIPYNYNNLINIGYVVNGAHSFGKYSTLIGGRNRFTLVSNSLTIYFAMSFKNGVISFIYSLLLRLSNYVFFLDCLKSSIINQGITHLYPRIKKIYCYDE